MGLAEKVRLNHGGRSKSRLIIPIPTWVEGYQKDPNECYLAGLKLPLPRSAGIIYDGHTSYCLFARARGYHEYQIKAGNITNIALIKIPMFERKTKKGDKLTHVRGIFTRSGKIYLDENIENKEKYLECIQERLFPELRTRFRL